MSRKAVKRKVRHYAGAQPTLTGHETELDDIELLTVHTISKENVFCPRSIPHS